VPIQPVPRDPNAPPGTLASAIVGEPSDRSSEIDLTDPEVAAGMFPAEEPPPAPTPGVVLATHFGADLSYRRATATMPEAFLWIRKTPDGPAPGLRVYATREGVVLAGLSEPMTANHLPDFLRLLRVAREVHVQLAHGQLPGYVLAELPHAESLAHAPRPDSPQPTEPKA
jgi:hypothetical protein